MLNEAPNNNDVKRVANNVFNKAPNSNDATRIGINVLLTAVGTQQFSMVTIDLFHVLQSYSGYYGNCYVGRQRKFVMPTTCAVFGCHNRQTKKIKRSFYRIPRDSDHRRRWLAFIGRRNKDSSPWEPGTGD